MRAVLCDCYPLDQSDLHILVLDLCLARLQTFTGLEGYGYDRSALQIGLYCQRSPDDCRQNRDNPYQLQGTSTLRLGHGIGNIGKLGLRIHVAHNRLSFLSGSQIRRGSKYIAASIVRTTTAPKATAPGPALTKA